jgi:hypothetical protein
MTTLMRGARRDTGAENAMEALYTFYESVEATYAHPCGLFPLIRLTTTEQYTDLPT